MSSIDLIICGVGAFSFLLVMSFITDHSRMVDMWKVHMTDMLITKIKPPTVIRCLAGAVNTTLRPGNIFSQPSSTCDPRQRSRMTIDLSLSAYLCIYIGIAIWLLCKVDSCYEGAL